MGVGYRRISVSLFKRYTIVGNYVHLKILEPILILPAVPRKWFGTADCDTICSIYLALCAQTYPTPFRGTHCTRVSVILPYQNTAKVYTYTVFRKGIETRSVPPLENLIFFQWFCTPLVLRRGDQAESWLASCSQRSWFTGIYCFTFVILLLCQRGGKG